MMKRHSAIWMPLILLLALLARAYGLDFPRYHWDEIADFSNVFSASHYGIRLIFYGHGVIQTYLTLGLWNLYLFLTGKSITTYNLLLTYMNNPRPLLLLARGLVVLASVSTVGIVYYIGKELFSMRSGLLAAFFLALNFLHVSESHYARGYVMATFFIALATYFSARLLKRKQSINAALAGICAGLATAFTYTAVVSIITPLVVCGTLLLNDRYLSTKNIYRLILITVYSMGIALLLATPIALLDSAWFAQSIATFLLATAKDTWINTGGQPNWLFAITEYLRNGTGLAFSSIAIIGIFYGLARRKMEDLVITPLILLIYVTLWSHVSFSRYLVPMLPGLCILIARLLDDLYIYLENHFSILAAQTTSIILCAIIVVEPAMNILRFDYAITQPDTRSIAANWIKEHIPPESQIAIEGGNIYGPQLPFSNTYAQDLLSNGTGDRLKNIMELWTIPGYGLSGERPGYSAESLTRLYVQATQNIELKENGYRLLILQRLDYVASKDVAVKFVDKGYQYLITTSWSQQNYPYSPEFLQSLYIYYEPIKIFEPVPEFRTDPYCFMMDYPALKKIIPGHPIVGGPRIIIYKLRPE